MSKYYFVTYISKRLGKQFFDSTIIDEHPFEWLKGSQTESKSRKVLVNWKEISEEEFQMYDEMLHASEIDKDQTPQPDLLEMISKDPSEGLRG